MTRSGLAVAQRSSPYTRDRERNARESRRVPVLSLTRDGLKTLDTLFFLNLANRTHEVIVDNGEGVFLGTQPFVGQDLWQMSSNGEYIVTVMQPTLDDAAAEVSLVLRRSDGHVLFRNNLPMPKTSTPRATFERRADSLLKEMNTGRDGRNTNEFSRASFYQKLIIPRTPPQVTKVMVSASGMVLVRGDDLGVAAVRHSIWSAGGTLVGTFTLPSDQMVCGFSGDKLWSVVDRADGSMHLVTQRFGQRTDPNRTPYATGARFRGSDR